MAGLRGRRVQKGCEGFTALEEMCTIRVLSNAKAEKGNCDAANVAMQEPVAMIRPARDRADAYLLISLVFEGVGHIKTTTMPHAFIDPAMSCEVRVFGVQQPRV